jgi:hypothetical protein
MTGLKKGHVSRTMKELCQKNILIRSGVKIGFQKDYLQWNDGSRKAKLPEMVTVAENGNAFAKLPEMVTELPGLGYTINTIQETKECASLESSETLIAGHLKKTKPRQSGQAFEQKGIPRPVCGPYTGLESETGANMPSSTAEGLNSRLGEIMTADRAKPRKARKPKKPTDPRIAEAISFFSDACQEIKGFKPEIAGGKDGGNVKKALKSMDLAELKECIRFFLKHPKSDEYPSMSAAVSVDTINLFRKSKATRSQNSVPDYKRQYA